MEKVVNEMAILVEIWFQNQHDQVQVNKLTTTLIHDRRHQQISNELDVM